MRTKFGPLRTLSGKHEDTLRFGFGACFGNEVVRLPKGRSSISAEVDYCLGLVVRNINQVQSCQGGANINHTECYTVRETRNNPLVESFEFSN
jgi:hypothetical protein